MTVLHHHLEMCTESATLYVSGVLRPGDVWELHQRCESVIRSARLLRVDLHGLVALEHETLLDVRAMLCDWCSTRGPGHAARASDGFRAPCDMYARLSLAERAEPEPWSDDTVWMPDNGPLVVLRLAKYWAEAVVTS
jgi:hypothetical protein